MQSPAFFHLFCWSFHGFCHSFWWFWSFFAIILFAIILNLFFLDLQKKQHFNSMPTVFPIVLSRYHCFFLNFWRILLFLGFALTFFTPDPAKSQKTLEMVRNTIPGLFPFVLCVFSHCFSQFFDGYCVIFWLRSHLFSSDPAKSQETLTLVADWALLSAAECCGVCCWEIQFQAFFHLFCVCFPIVLMDFVLFFGFVLTFFTPDPAKSQETLKLVADWALLSAAECCWEIQFPSFFPFFCLCFSFVLSRVHCFSNLFDGFCAFFWLRSHLFHPWPWKKSGNLEIGCRLSTAECCWVLLGNPIPILFPFFLSVFFFCPEFILSPIFLMDFVFFWLRSQLFHPWPCKKSGNLEIGCRLSTAECCWEIQFPSFFH